MRKQNKKLFNNKYQLRKIFLSANNLILKHNIKLDNKYDLKLVFRWDKLFQIQRTDSIKDIYILKELNETRFERTYADNQLKRFKTRNTENLSMKQIEIHKMLNIVSENSIDAMKKLNIVNKDVRINDEVWNKTVWNTIESLYIDGQIFEDDITDDNLSNSKTWNIHVKTKFNTRRSNWLIKIKNLLNSIKRRTSIAAFTTIDKVSIEKKWNAMKIENFEIYINNCNSEDFCKGLVRSDV